MQECSNVSTTYSSSNIIYSFTISTNSEIYFAISAGGNNNVPFLISTESSQKHENYNWDLTSLSTNWASGN